MPIKDQEIMQIIENIRDHYQKNINNRYIRKAFMHIEIPKEASEGLERLTEKNDYYKIQGYHYKELYEQIHAAATFVYHAKQEILPGIKTYLAGGSDTVFSRKSVETERDRVLRDMAINNLKSNLGIFADMLNELYIKVVNSDKEDHPGSKPIYTRMPELKEIGQLLV